MTTLEQVAEADGIQPALLAIAAALDRIENRLSAVDPFGATPTPAWDDWTSTAVGTLNNQTPEERAEAASIAHRDAVNTTDVVLVAKPVSTERYNERSAFAFNVLQLDKELGDDTDWTEVYAKGGPLWLYTHRPELVRQYSTAAKQVMVNDLELDDPKTAAEMARDILKQTSTPPAFG